MAKPLHFSGNVIQIEQGDLLMPMTVNDFSSYGVIDVHQTCPADPFVSFVVLDMVTHGKTTVKGTLRGVDTSRQWPLIRLDPDGVFEIQKAGAKKQVREFIRDYNKPLEVGDMMAYMGGEAVFCGWHENGLGMIIYVGPELIICSNPQSGGGEKPSMIRGEHIVPHGMGTYFALKFCKERTKESVGLATEILKKMGLSG